MTHYLLQDQRNAHAQIQQYFESTSHITVENDENSQWFNNPQYCMVVNKPTNVLVSLTQQQDQRNSDLSKDYAAIGFDVIRHKREESLCHSRVWMHTKRNYVTSSSKSFATRTREGSIRGEREVVKGNVMLDPNWTYNIVVYTKDQGQEGEFTIRVIANSEVALEPVPVTHSLYNSGVWGWQSSRNIDTAGGGLTVLEDRKGIQFNPSWCQNPQYWVKSPEGAQYNDVTIKLVLKREVSISEESPNNKSPKRRRSTMNNPVVGMVICRAEPVIGKELNTPRQRKRPASALRKNARQNGEILEKETKCLSEKDNSHGRGALGNEIMPERRIFISDTEWCQASSYGDPYYASMMLPKVKSDWLQNGLIITPSFDQKGVKGEFKLEVHSGELLELHELSNKGSTTVASEWKKSTSGGCHLRPNWANNPIFHLQMKQAGEFKVNICASRPEKEWSGECSKDRIGSMIGFYIIKGTKLTSRKGLITHNGEAWDSSPFSTSHSISTPLGFTLNFSGPEEVYSIVPCTYNEGKTGTFFLTVSSTSEFVLRRNQRDPGRQGSPCKSPQSSSNSPATNHSKSLCKIKE